MARGAPVGPGLPRLGGLINGAAVPPLFLQPRAPSAVGLGGAESPGELMVSLGLR